MNKVIALLFCVLFVILVLIHNKGVNMNNYNIKEGNNSIKIDYPSTRYRELSKEIDKFIKNSIDDFYRDIMEYNRYTSNYIIINYKEYRYRNIVSYIFFTEVYYGGAHPSHLIWTVNYNIKLNKIIDINDLVKTNQKILDILSNYSYNVISKDKSFNNNNILDMLKTGTKPEAKNFKNILFTSRGLLIYFERYQIAPYYFGDYHILVPYHIIYS